VFVQQILDPYFWKHENMSWSCLKTKKKNDLVSILLVNAQVRHISFMVEEPKP